MPHRIVKKIHKSSEFCNSEIFSDKPHYMRAEAEKALIRIAIFFGFMVGLYVVSEFNESLFGGFVIRC